MGTLNFPGLSTGIDTTQLIKSLMAINSRRLANYTVKKIRLGDQQTALDEMKSKVSQLEGAADALSDSSTLETFTTSSSDGSRLGVAATTEANPGSHSVEINQLATSETWIQDSSTFDYETDYVGAGYFIYSYNYQERVITTTATTTLEDLVGLINNDEDNPGLTASLLYQGDKYHLMLGGQDTGEDYQISINSSTTEVWKPDTGEADDTFTDDSENAVLADKIIELDQWDAAHTGNEYITISGKNNAGTTILPSRDLTISDDTTLEHLIKEINTFFEGFATATLVNGQIVLTDHTSGASSMEISLTYNANGSSATLGLPTMAVSTEGGGTVASVASLSPSSFTQTQNAQNSEIKIDNYTPTMVSEVQTITPDVVASGVTYTLTYDGQTTAALDHDATIGDVETALNNLSNLSGVTVGGDDLTSTNGMTVTFADTDGNVDMLSIDIGSLTGPSAVTVSETTRGNNEEWVSRNSNVVTDALTGVTLILQDVNDTDSDDAIIPLDFTVSRNAGAVQGKVQNMVNTYNSLLTYVEDKTEYNVSAKEMGLLSRDVAISLIKSQMKDPFIGTVTGFTSEDGYFQASDLGLSFDGYGKMTFDTSTFSTALEDNYLAVINLLGASARGNTDSEVIEFYAASAKHTTPDTYDVQVTVASGAITSAQIKLTSESTYRDMTIDGSLIEGDDSFDDDGYNPVYSENGLFLNVDLTSDGDFTATLRVKQGLAGALEDTLDDVIETDGRLDVSKDSLQTQIDSLSKTITRENERLENVEDRLIAKFARLEKALSNMQGQMSAVSLLFPK
jgi:flagellar hook-associated protein 2